MRRDGAGARDSGAAAMADSDFNIDYILRQCESLREVPADGEMHVMLQLQQTKQGVAGKAACCSPFGLDYLLTYLLCPRASTG